MTTPSNRGSSERSQNFTIAAEVEGRIRWLIDTGVGVTYWSAGETPLVFEYEHANQKRDQINATGAECWVACEYCGPRIGNKANERSGLCSQCERI